MDLRQLETMSIGNFMATFMPTNVVSDLHRAQLTEDVCPGLRFITDHSKDAESKVRYGSCCDISEIKFGPGGVDSTLERCFSCHHSVIFQLVCSIDDNVMEYVRILRTTRTSIHATPRFNSKLTPWLGQFLSRFAVLLDASEGGQFDAGDAVEEAAEEARKTIDTKWLGYKPPVQITSGKRETMGVKISVAPASDHSYYIGLDIGSKEIQVLQIAPWLRNEIRKRKRRRHRLDLQSIRSVRIRDGSALSNLTVMKGALEAHLKATENSTLHGDLAPQNIMLIRGNKGGLIDWEHGRSVNIQREERYKKELERFQTHLFGDFMYRSQ